MKTYTVIAKCQHIDTGYTLRHDGEKWTEAAPFEETTFSTLDAAEKFAEKESEKIDVRHEMVIVEFDDDSRESNAPRDLRGDSRVTVHADVQNPPLKAQLKAAGVRWRKDSTGLLRLYIRTAPAQRMKDGSWWNGTETIGRYPSWEIASTCSTVKEWAERGANTD